jgi:hypothetical protein
MNRLICAIAFGLVVVCGTAGAERLASTTGGESKRMLVAQAQQPPPQTQPGPPPSPEQRVAMLKQWLQASQAQLRGYEWVETTVLTKDGEEKSRKQNRCYYGADGKVQEVPIAQEAEGKSGGPPGVLPPGRLLKKAGEKQKDELIAYMQKVAALVHSYVPPEQGRIQQAVNAGKFSITPGQRVRLDFHDYLKGGDLLSVEIEGPTNRLIGMAVSSYLEKPEDAVKMTAEMGVLPDGTIYVRRTAIDAIAKGVLVTIENTGHRPVGG